MKKLLKKMIHKFIIDDKGAVSIYLIIITLLLFFFNAVLIDFARIIVAERQTDEAAKTALRSTMSAYNKPLQDKGLFGFEGGQSDADAIFQEVFAENLKNDVDGAFNLIGLEPVEDEVVTELNLERSLASPDILEYQILEEMKYKAPVEVGVAILEKFLSVSSAVEEASDYADIAKEVNKKAKKREEDIDDALEYLENAKKIIDDMDSKVNGTGNSTYPEVNNLADIRNKKNKYVEYHQNKDKDEDDEELDDEEKEEKEKDKEKDKKNAEDFKKAAREVVEDLINEAISADVELLQALSSLKSAEELNDEIIDKVNNPESKNNDYENAKDLSESNVDGENESLMSTLQDYIIDEDLLTGVIDSVNDAIFKIDTDSIRTDTFIPKLERDFLPRIESHFNVNFTKRVEAIQEYHEEILGSITTALDTLNEEQTEYKDNQKEVEEKDDEGDEALEENKDEFDDIKKDLETAAGALSDTEKLQKIGRDAKEYGNAIQENETEFSMEDKDDTADEAFNFLDMLFKNIGSMLLTARDKVYVNEYILLRFKSHDHSGQVSNPNHFENNQVEYILYGLEGHGLNYFAALSEIFAVRFGLNLAAGFLRPEAKGFGPYVWAYALAYSFTNTADDMRRLRSNKPIRLFKGKIGGKTAPMITYKDHLRLFLFAHMDGDKTERLMAVLDEDTGAKLTEKSTYITGKASSSIKLWFLPQIADMLGRSEIIDGRVEGNKFIFEKEVHYSY